MPSLAAVTKPILALLLAGAWFWLSAAFAGEQVKVQLNWKHQFEFAAFYAAQAQGFYRDAGLDVEIIEGGPGIDSVKQVASGHADFGVGTSALVVERARGQPVMAIATLMQHSPIALLAPRRSGIESVHDLAGRPIAVDPHSRDEIESFLRASGIAADKIDLVDQVDWTLDSINSGRIAAKAIYTSNETYLIRGQEHEYLLLRPRSAGIDLYGNILFTRDEVFRKRPAVVKGFREATLKGLDYALRHPDVVSELILAKYNTQRKTRDHLLFEAEQIRELTRPDIVEPGYMSAGRWRHVVEVYADRGKLPADFDLEDFIYDPTQKGIPHWILWTLGFAIGGMLVAMALVIKVRAFNAALRREIGEREQAQAALRVSEAKYRELVDNANAIILRMAPDGTVTYFNEFAENFFGYPSAEILGQHVVGSIVPDTESGTGRDLSEMIAGKIGRAHV
jgi:ABC-type nitrate/sulfonate/bicarbonate transport system substrate-binding protein